MSQTIRFPLLRAQAGTPDESAFVITLLNAVTQLDVGGAANYTSLAPWKRNTNGIESPFTCVFVEFTAPQALTLGDGTIPIGLYGEIDLKTTPATRQRTLLGILGVNFAGTTAPQIPIVAQGGGDIVGFSQIISNVAEYDALSVGGVTGNIVLAEGETVTVKVRPLIRRDWLG